MPIVMVEMWEGRTSEQKETLIKGITKAFEEIGAKAESLYSDPRCAKKQLGIERPTSIQTATIEPQNSRADRADLHWCRTLTTLFSFLCVCFSWCERLDLNRRSSSFLVFVCVWVGWCGRLNLNRCGGVDLCVCAPRDPL